MSGHAWVKASCRAAALVLAGPFLALTGCKEPVLGQGEAKLFQDGCLAFLRVGRTTREEVLLRLGTPTAHLEGERVLTFAFATVTLGGWTRTARSTRGPRPGASPEYAPGTANLVLVFGADGVLADRSLVVAP